MTLRKLLSYWWIWPWFPLGGLVLFLLLPFEIALPLYVVASAWSIIEFVVWWRTERLPVKVGVERLIGREVEVLSAHGNRGTVSMDGELWRVQCDDPLQSGDRVKVTGTRKTTLIVERLSATNAE